MGNGLVTPEHDEILREILAELIGINSKLDEIADGARSLKAFGDQMSSGDGGNGGGIAQMVGKMMGIGS